MGSHGEDDQSSNHPLSSASSSSAMSIPLPLVHPERAPPSERMQRLEWLSSTVGPHTFESEIGQGEKPMHASSGV